MAEALTAVESSIAEVSAFVVAAAWPAPAGLGGFVATMAAWRFASMTLKMFLLLVKNGGGWPE